MSLRISAVLVTLLLAWTIMGAEFSITFSVKHATNKCTLRPPCNNTMGCFGELPQNGSTTVDPNQACIIPNEIIFVNATGDVVSDPLYVSLWATKDCKTFWQASPRFTIAPGSQNFTFDGVFGYPRERVCMQGCLTQVPYTGTFNVDFDIFKNLCMKVTDSLPTICFDKDNVGGPTASFNTAGLQCNPAAVVASALSWLF